MPPKVRTASPASLRRERDRRLREQDFLDAAERLFAEKGYAGTGMEEIASRAGYGTGTLYLYFSSKKTLYQALLDRKTADYFGCLREAAQGEGGPSERLAAMLAAQFAYLREHRDFIRIYVTEFLRPNCMLSAGLSTNARLLERKHELLLERLVLEGVECGEFRVVDPVYVVAALKGLGEQILLTALSAAGGRDSNADAFDAGEQFMVEFVRRALRR